METHSPVAFIVFNRPDLTLEVLQRIREARPKKLLVVADGPRAHVPSDAEKCAAVRKIIDENIDWECEVLKNYADENLGCRKRVSSGLDWVFENVEEAIILEDDCLVDLSFFKLCDELLVKYKNDPKVMLIGADHRYTPPDYPYSYCFIRVPFIWGWASWRRAWKEYDVDMKSWPEFRDSQQMQKMGWKSGTIRFYTKYFDKMYHKEIDTWDYQWVYAILKNQGACVHPTVNLIKNIGFRADATHTKFESALAKREAEVLPFPLKHPPHVALEWSIDHALQKKYQALGPRVLNKIKQVFAYFSLE